MITIDVPEREYYNSETNEFIVVPGKTLELEHSLLSVSKWEAKWKRPFLSESKGPHTNEELLDYVQCMTINKNVNPLVYKGITSDQFKVIMNYISDTMTATWFSEKRRRGRTSNSEITSEVLYWQMCQWGIPFECQKWHLNRLLTLIRVCAEKGEPPRKMGQDDILRQYAATNAKRRKPKKH